MQSAEKYAKLAEDSLEVIGEFGDKYAQDGSLVSVRLRLAQVYATLAQAAAIVGEMELVQPTDKEMVCQIYGFLSQLQKEGAGISDYVVFMKQLCEEL